MIEPETRPACFVASYDGVAIACAVHGAGKPALVLIHGWSCDSSYWAGQIEPLSRDFQLITLDLGGHGASGTDREAWTIESFGRDVAAVVEALDPDQVVLVGHSMGGNVAIAAAPHLSKRVRGVVCVDTYRKLGSPRSPDDIRQLLAPFRASFRETTDAYVRGMFPSGADEGLVRRVSEDMSAAPPPIAIAALESSLNFGRTITDTLKEIAAPIVAINAEPTDVASMRGHGVEVVTMRGVGHFLMMEAPHRFNHRLNQVARRLSAP